MKIYRVTALVMYETCPHCFYLAHVLKIKRKKDKNLEFGIQAHKAIEDYHKVNDTQNLSFYLQTILISYRKFYPDPRNYEFIEKRIIKELIHPTTGESLGVKISGKIDIGRNGWIEDHKTSSRRYRQKEVDNHFQLKSYAYLYWRETGKLPTGVRINAIVKNKVPYVQPVDSYVTKEDLVTWFEYVRRLLERIEHEQFEPSNYWWHAFDICPGSKRR